VPELWLLVLASSVATYFWRGLGVLLSGRIRVDGEIFKWITCVAYAMVAGLVSRILVMPTGMLAHTALTDRLAACVLALVAYHLTRRNLLVAVAVGVGAMMAMAAARG
jgi:branched-subunit amino acid transport protein